MQAVLVLSLTLLIAPVGRAAEPVIGLLTLPGVFGTAPCERFTPQEVPLYSAPDSSGATGVIRVDRNWTFAEHGGCEGLTVNVHRHGTNAVAELPTMEYEYEAPAAVVLRQRGRWFELRLSDGTAWVHASASDRYLPLRDLLADGLTYMTDEWDRMLAAVPGRAERVPLPADPRRNVVGYLQGRVSRVGVVLQQGQSVDSIRARYRASALTTRAGPNGTRIVSLRTGAAHPLFATPDRSTRSVGEVETHRCGNTLRTGAQDRVLVFEHRPGWYQVAPGYGSGGAERLWLEEHSDWRFHSVDNAAERERLALAGFGPEYLSVRVTDFEDVAGALWVEVEVLSHSLCEGSLEPTVRARGWIPAHAPSGELNTWFSSRGC
jgi:hypothetical protein